MGTDSNSRILYKEDIDKYHDSTGCIPEYAKKYIDSNTGILDITKMKNEEKSLYDELFSTMKKCENMSDGEEGCCYYKAINRCKNNHETGIKGKQGSEIEGPICHTDDIQNTYNTLLDDPNKTVKFLKLIALSLFALIITALLGTCYEFWLRYGHAIDCIYYTSKCKNIGETNKISLVDYMFPSSLCFYPYQSCGKTDQNLIGGSKKLRGGSKTEGIISSFIEYETSGAKCINLDYDTDFDKSDRPIPYNFADYAIKNIDSNVIKILAKTISFYYLFTVLFIRKILNYIMKNLSINYQKIVKFNPVLSNLTFLLLTGIIFPLIAALSGINLFTMGPMFLLSGILILTLMLSNIGFFVSLISIFNPAKFYKHSLQKCNIPDDYYEIDYRDLFFSIRGVSAAESVKNVCLNILLFFPIIILILWSISFGACMSVFSGLILSISLFAKFFYIPISNPLESLSILKSHGDLLTILFCIGVIGAAGASLDSTSTGIMSLILVILIGYKLISGLKNNI
tara:strand:- start:9457 stop:10992 length:1536 start_codon:yes stop_codon:yes gene_type:complete